METIIELIEESYGDIFGQLQNEKELVVQNYEKYLHSTETSKEHN